MNLMKTLLLSLVWLAAGVVQAQTYPSKPVRVIVPFPPGGTTDIVARLVADQFAATLGQPAVVENRAGAGGSVGATEIARAAPDGYTLGLATVSTHGVNPAINPKLPYDPLRDFTPISNLATVPNVVSAHPATGINDLKGLIEKAKASPGKITYASAGMGSLSAHAGRALQIVDFERPAACALQGLGPRAQRHAGRTGEHLLRQPVLVPASHPVGQAARARGVEPGAARCPSERADVRRSRRAAVERPFVVRADRARPTCRSRCLPRCTRR